MSKVGEHVSVAGVAVVTAAVVMFGWIGYELSDWPPGPPQDAAARSATTKVEKKPAGTASPRPTAAVPSDEPSATPTAPSRPLRVALLSDGLAIDAASWFNRTIAAREVDGAVPGAIASQVGLGASQLEARASLASQADVVVVQAGTVDLVNGNAPETAAAALEGLLQTALDLGGPTRRACGRLGPRASVRRRRRRASWPSTTAFGRSPARTTLPSGI